MNLTSGKRAVGLRGLAVSTTTRRETRDTASFILPESESRKIDPANYVRKPLKNPRFSFATSKWKE